MSSKSSMKSTGSSRSREAIGRLPRQTMWRREKHSTWVRRANPVEGIKTTSTSGKTPTIEMSCMGEEDNDLLLEDQLVLEGLSMMDTNPKTEAETHPGEGTHPGGGQARQEGKNPSCEIVKIVVDLIHLTGVKSIPDA